MSQENVEIVRSIYYVAADGPAPGGSTGLAGMAEVQTEAHGIPAGPVVC